MILNFIALVVGAVLTVTYGDEPPPSPSAKPGSSIIAAIVKKQVAVGPHGSILYEMSAEGATYGSDGIPRVLNLTSDGAYEAGYDTGFLLGREYKETFDSILKSMYGGGIGEQVFNRLFCKFLDRQFKYLAKDIPDEYKQELQGLSEGGEKAGLRGFMNDVGTIAQRAIVMANFPSTLSDLKFVVKNEHFRRDFDDEELRDIEAIMASWKSWDTNDRARPRGMGCSMVGAWGGRTQGAKVFTGRNLDWMPDTGLAKHKLLTVHHPAGGKAHVDIGWSGVWGALAGISEAGITVHEANLESDDSSFEGFPWILRLRYIMERANNLQEAMTLWNGTTNTVGFNHGIGSASDNRFTVLETMYHNTAEFGSLDPREIANGGDPRSDSVWRTNHGFDPYTIEHFMWNGTKAYNDSLFRYSLVPPMLDSYEASGTAIGAVEMVNMTAILGGKGTKKDYFPFQCGPPPYPGDADNVLSVAFAPDDLIAYAAYESGTGDGWIPAGCNTYLKFDMKAFF